LTPVDRLTAIILHGGGGDAYRYRCLHLAAQLSLLGVASRVVRFRPGEARPVPPADLVVIHRIPLDGFLRRQLEARRADGATILADVDDLVFEPAEAQSFAETTGLPGWQRALFLADVRGIRRAIGFADGVLVASTYLVARAAAAGGRALLHRNAFSEEMRAQADRSLASRHRRTRVRIGYASGTPTHERDFAPLRPLLQGLLDGHLDVELVLAGHIRRGTWPGAEDRVTTVAFVSWREHFDTLASFDVNLAPLELGRPFCEAKSEVKYLEAALVSVPTVASPIAAFREAIRHGDNGFLAASNEDWRRALAELASRSELRVATGRRAREAVLASDSCDARAAELAVLLDEARRAAGRDPWGLAVRGGGPDPVVEPPDAAPFEPRSPGARALRLWHGLRYEGLRTTAARLRGAIAMRRQDGTAEGSSA